jgi:hypothetical protein
MGAGYYDFATPYFTAKYDIEHMFLRPEQRKNVQFYFYESGHMYYIHKPSLVQFKKDVDALIDKKVEKDEAIFQVLKKYITESKKRDAHILNLARLITQEISLMNWFREVLEKLFR